MWLAIEGLIGAGKTTTVELLAVSTGVAAVIERSDLHPFLDSYYADPQHVAIETEVGFMLIQRHQLRDPALPLDRISDFSPAKNMVFARTVCSREELDLLRDVEAKLWQGIAEPDLTIFLEVPIQVCMERIRLRGRPYEQQLTVSDLERLAKGYMGSLGNLGARTEKIELDGSETPAAVAGRVASLAGLGAAHP